MDIDHEAAADMAAAFTLIAHLPPERRAVMLRRLRQEARRLRLPTYVPPSPSRSREE